MKLIRISLGLAIAACLATAILNFVQVKEKINTTLAERDENAKQRDFEKGEHKKFEKLAKDTQSKLDKTTEELTSTKDQLDKTLAENADLTKRSTKLAEDLKKTTQERDTAQNDLAAWRALGVPITQMKATLASLKTVTEERDAIEAEKKILNRTIEKLNNELALYRDPEHEVKLPAGLKGKVLVADPRYDFVVLDIGEKQNVLEGGQMLVNRDGKLIAKVRIKSIQQDRCIANIVPGWKLGDVMEGDQVLY